MKKTRILKLICMLLLSSVLTTACSSGTSNVNTNNEQNAGVDWPTKSVEIVIPFSAGGDTDFNARVLAKHLEAKLGKPFAVTNVTGSGGTIAAAKVKDSKNDGYTILLTHVALNISQAASVIDFGFEDFDMGPITARSIGDAILVRGDSPWNTIEEMIADTKANPGKYKIAANTGATTHWVAIGLQNAGAEFNVVDSGSASERIPALLGGHVDVICNSLSSVKDYVDTGEFKALAIANSERITEYPEIPTLSESGVEVEFECSYTLLFPKGTDKAIIDKISASIEDIVQNNEEYRNEIYNAYQQQPFYLSPEETEVYFSNELERLMSISEKLQGK
ncbi:tripartite tricarboxylate transporter substrate binding protein [Tissierella sp. Yu-01]|uniref:tripartite tricarboxylate transporter substrate binding protein n=1 Tax=Tissierella sp. Yu-01 TaxID=3035694 RepID=UPI00240D9541|nr:tripartite tricarboxylate transporter substrate binding protein [Tissierella sp. Yu-01]WFA08071.1 tripartite tricarboxylate transporter substrate binding protein [Tissierella sp. Yu-01]